VSVFLLILDDLNILSFELMLPEAVPHVVLGGPWLPKTLRAVHAQNIGLVVLSSTHQVLRLLLGLRNFIDSAERA
jgi:hypothetical protein